MRADLLQRLSDEALAPEGIAVRIDALEMRQLLMERHALLSAADAYLKARTAEEYDSSRKGLINAVSVAVKP